MSIILLLISVIGILVFIIIRNPIIELLGKNNPMVTRLKRMMWFQNHWFSGIFIFLLNALLFGLTGLILFGITTRLMIPFIHIPIMFGAVILSIYFWSIVNQAWSGKKRDRLKMGTVGSSFYAVLACYFVYELVTLEPLFPGDDTFMAAIGLFFGIIVTTVAFATCLIMTGFRKQKPGDVG
ncbi:hypothetical protein [Bacillus pinisoli]|uniref:hypothetical protein n=1 Tax=Bacillus pinisoli TaxID=2901866 RepID=UPI001FF6C972|nr:hypothetical protein [Bacillus pinisoli]